MERGKFHRFIRWTWHALIGRFDKISNLSLDLDKIQEHAEVRDTSFPVPSSQMPRKGIYQYRGNDPDILFGRSNINLMLPNFHYIELGEKPVIQPTRLRKYLPLGILIYAILILLLGSQTSDPCETHLLLNGPATFLIFIPSILLHLYFIRLLESWFVEQTFYVP